jgi:hypothetical protein
MAWLIDGASARLTALALLLLVPAPVAAEIPSTPEARQAVIENLPWQGKGKYELPTSKSSMDLPDGYLMVTGKDAAALYEAINGTDAPDGLEAVVLDPKAGSIIMFKTTSARATSNSTTGPTSTRTSCSRAIGKGRTTQTRSEPSTTPPPSPSWGGAKSPPSIPTRRP